MLCDEFELIDDVCSRLLNLMCGVAWLLQLAISDPSLRASVAGWRSIRESPTKLSFNLSNDYFSTTISETSSIFIFS